MPETTFETRVYPSCCSSWNCSGVGVLDDCKGCPNKPTIDSFDAWQDEHKAVCDDGCGVLWTATK